MTTTKKIVLLTAISAVVIPIIYFWAKGLMFQIHLDQLDEYVRTVSKTKVYADIRRKLADTVDYWKKVEMRGVMLESKIVWKVDTMVLFNADTTKALLFLMQYYPEDNTSLQDIQFISAKRLSREQWKYYICSMLSIGIRADPTIIGAEKNFDRLSRICRRDIVEGGYYHPWSFGVNYTYINDWETSFNLEEQERLFWYYKAHPPSP